MTFTDMAQQMFGFHLSDRELTILAAALCNGYCEGLKACSWRIGGIDYVGELHTAMKLSEAVATVQARFGPLTRLSSR